MEEAKTGRTYCYGTKCKKYETCSRYVGKYNFKKDELYSFMYDCNNTLYEEE